jgi:hypothetical protein
MVFSIITVFELLTDIIVQRDVFFFIVVLPLVSSQINLAVLGSFVKSINKPPTHIYLLYFFLLFPVLWLYLIKIYFHHYVSIEPSLLGFTTLIPSFPRWLGNMFDSIDPNPISLCKIKAHGMAILSHHISIFYKFIHSV